MRKIRSISPPKDMKEGSVHKTKFNGALQVIKYNRSDDVIVRFESTGFERSTQSAHIRLGIIKDPMRRSVFNIGFIGVGVAEASHKRRSSKVYVCWHEMLKRCYYHNCNMYYAYGGVGVTVCDEWHNFQNFYKWYVEQCKEIGINHKKNNYQLDKDGLTGNGKGMLYSPVMCKLRTRQENIEISHSLNFTFTSPEGLLVDVFNLKKFCRDNNLINGCMWNISKGKQTTHRGWTANNKREK